MKKVIFYLVVPFIFQQCTDELQEIDGVVASSDINNKGLMLDENDVPLNAFTSFYHLQVDQKVAINKDKVKMIQLGRNDFNSTQGEFSGIWEGNFEFLDGEYEFTYFSDRKLKIVVGDKVLFDGISTEKEWQKKITHSIAGIRRLKVFYNMSGDQKLQQIINYYKRLNEADQDDDLSNPIPSSLRNDQSNKIPDPVDLRLFLDWQLIRKN